MVDEFAVDQGGGYAAVKIPALEGSVFALGDKSGGIANPVASRLDDDQVRGLTDTYLAAG